ncbi:Der GTPase-activating protein YihI [Paraferrimonas sedimenticola]|uniref:Der GTPase-activating protein YihI n=1 Tax=Paraferrimonas sedimenticola TaxID=375674 RepID=A0AA37RUH7_9GAMM|nr:Der GTPase-activating protein YihI [Paraferrimonas sedimenticola]GLP95418.1 Der GTPase-activating protein YihI [Paraferrimonas sedimenticola]
MSRSKKSRKINSNGPRLQPKAKAKSVPESKKKGKGRKSGSRADTAQAKPQTKANAAVVKSPMHGSKKPISLVAKRPQTQTKLPEAERLNETPPEQRLMQLENDPRLNRLLDKADSGAKMSAQDRKWMNEQLDIISALMDQLGIEIDEAPDHEQNANLSDDERMLADFDTSLDSLQDFRSDK